MGRTVTSIFQDDWDPCVGKRTRPRSQNHWDTLWEWLLMQRNYNPRTSPITSPLPEIAFMQVRVQSRHCLWALWRRQRGRLRRSHSSGTAVSTQNMPTLTREAAPRSVEFSRDCKHCRANCGACQPTALSPFLTSAAALSFSASARRLNGTL